MKMSNFITGSCYDIATKKQQSGLYTFSVLYKVICVMFIPATKLKITCCTHQHMLLVPSTLPLLHSANHKTHSSVLLCFPSSATVTNTWYYVSVVCCLCTRSARQEKSVTTYLVMFNMPNVKAHNLQAV
jgi:hypothetical protein